ncbi:MAG: 3-phenylpropionate/cinnamic acid dioxygenase subunit beta [Pigmentiphaga sp.]|nr:3-phenylpropionate/cinnamic acid dioxygenase subunit beta [Pigmentiphaga sp.]
METSLQTAATVVEVKGIDRLLLQQEIEEFLYAEAEALDRRRFEEWLDMLADDLVYHMPIRRNVKQGEHDARENTRAGRDINWFEDDKWTLGKRVAQIRTRVHWAEEPLSRVSHLVTNVLLGEVRDGANGEREVDISSRFLLYQNRVETETNIFVGKRYDTLRRGANGRWQVARRQIILDQNVLLAKNLTVFF